MHWSTEMEADTPDTRWRGRPVAALLMRVAIFAAPIVASVGASALVSRLLPAPETTGALLGWWGMLMGISTVVLIVVDKVARRLMPLALLLRLSMLFPGPAPSRWSVSRGTSTRELERRMAKARSKGFAHEPARAAATILSLVSALSIHDRRTRGHAERVAMYTEMLAVQLKLDQRSRDRLRWAAMLHDIGKLKIPSALLNKAAKPTPGEWQKIKSHPHDGAELARPLQAWLGEWGLAIPEHHERWDGTGYPNGTSGKDISLAARIVAVADAYEVMTTARAYKKPMSPAAARNELTACAGTQFDPAIVRSFLQLSLGRLNWMMGPISWLAQVPFVPAYRPLLPVVQPLSTTVTQVAAAGTLAITPVASLPAAVPDLHVDVVHAAPAGEERAEAASEERAGGDAQPGSAQRGRSTEAPRKAGQSRSQADQAHGKADEEHGKADEAHGRSGARGSRGDGAAAGGDGRSDAAAERGRRDRISDAAAQRQDAAADGGDAAPAPRAEPPVAPQDAGTDGRPADDSGGSAPPQPRDPTDPGRTPELGRTRP